MGKKLEWKSLNKELLLKTRIMDINTQSAVSPEGNVSTFIVLDAPDWAIIVPFLDKDQAYQEYGITEDCFLMVSQWRHGSESLSTEFPGGVVDKGEDPLIGAKRELLEETGYEAGEVIHLGSINPNPAIYKNTLHIYCAKHLKNTHTLNLDDDEFVSFKAVPVTEVKANMGKEPYVHALMATALMYYCQSEKSEI